MRRRFIPILAAALVMATLGYLSRGPLATRLVPATAKRAMAANLVNSLPDGLHLILCGAGGPMPDPRRSGPCVGIIAGRSLFVVDAGTGGGRNLVRMHVPVGSIAAVFLTHFHSDHIDGLGELAMLRWVGAANRIPLPVYGPPGVERIVDGFDQAYQADAAYRTAHHGPAVAPPEGAGLRAQPFTVPEDGSPATVWNAEGVRITAFRVDHRPAAPAVGYRFDYGGRSLVLSGDTRKSPAVERASRGVDLLVHEALAAHLVALMNRAAAETGARSLERILHDIPGYHTTPVEAARIASAARVGALLYYHVVPPLPLPGLEAAFLRGVSGAYRGRVVLGRDGTLASMPGDSRKICFSNLL